MIEALGGAAIGGSLYAVFCRLEARQPLRELLYETRLRFTSLRKFDSLAAARDRADVVVALTTIPSRLPFLGPTLKSLLAQSVTPRAVLIHLPKRSRRERVEYHVPDDLHDLKVVEVVRCEDWGPATKILPALLSSQAHQRIISVDDDRIYRPNFIEDLLTAADEHPEAAIGCCGLRVPHDRVDHRMNLVQRTFEGLRLGKGVSLRGARLRTPMEVDVLHGYGGLLVRPRFFDLDALADFDAAPAAAWLEDDTWFAAHCTARKLIVPGRPASFPRYFDRRRFRLNRLGTLNRGTVEPKHRNTTVLMQLHSDRWLD